MSNGDVDCGMSQERSKGSVAALTHDLLLSEPRPPEFLPVNPLNDFDLLIARLGVEVSKRYWLDAFLLAAGAGQVLDDYMRGSRATLRRGARYLSKGHGGVYQVGASALRLTAAALERPREALPGARRLAYYRETLSDLTDQLAPLALNPETAPAHQALDGIDRAAGTATTLAVGLPQALRRGVLRLPACSRCFDQHSRWRR